MKIGVDLRVLQIGHQYRGIGEVTKQCLNRSFELALGDEAHHPTFVFYEYDDGIDPKQFLIIPKGLIYEEVLLGQRPSPQRVPSKAEKLAVRWRSLFGAPLRQAERCDVFLQFDYTLSVPRRPRTVLVAHDLIPYIFWNDYFASAWLHFKHKSPRSALRTLLNNYEFQRIMRRAHRNAARILCVSESTSRDLQKYLQVPASKLSVMPLGVSLQPARTGHQAAQRRIDLPTKPYLLFVGGIDKRRRRVDDLIAAYNNLKASGHDIQLVLVGENFQSPETIPVETVRKAVAESSYRQDIITLGYIDDKTKQELYKKALAFVFPTIYEGFGIPILEAMLLGCPVIVYRNSSIPEVGGEYVLYAKDWSSIRQQVLKVQTMSALERQALVDEAKRHARQFTWEKTAAALYAALTNWQNS